MTKIKKEAVETTEIMEAVETAGAGKNGKKSEGEYLKNLVQVPCIWYYIIFWKKSVHVSALFDSDSKINTIHPTFVKELGLLIKQTDVGAQKVDGIILDIFGIVVAAFSVANKANQVRFFKKTFFMANVSPEIKLRMLFLTLSDADVNFLD